MESQKWENCKGEIYMNYKSQIGVSTTRKDAWDKVTGNAKYNGDMVTSDMLHCRILTSTHAHALIKKIDISKALKSKGVQTIITGDYSHALTGSMINDRPPIAKDKVRYWGEPVALVIGNTEQDAAAAVNLIEVEYEDLPVVNSIEDAIKLDATLVHENLQYYYYPNEEICPIANSNISNHIKIRKGNMDYGWAQSDVKIEFSFSMPQSDHLAMETRNAMAEISSDGVVNIYTSTQAPFGVKEEISKIYNIPEGKVIVHTPLVGGAFGGKAAVQLEFLAYLASHAVGGRMVRISNPREQDISSFPSKLGAEGKIKIGATKEGIIKALECIYFIDCGAYVDIGPRMAKAMAADCSGPYNIENIRCDTFSIYTNHCYATSYRGFGHGVSIFAIDRAIEKLSKKLGMDSLEIRRKNTIRPGDLAPTQDKITLSNTGDLDSCLVRLKEIMDWDQGNKMVTEDGKIRAKGISALWKTSSSPTNAISGTILTLNSDGSVNLNLGAVEIGPGMKTIVAQIFAEKMKMDIDDVHVFMGVDTQVSPKHWKTVASMTTIMAGNAAIKAAEDLTEQLLELGSIVLRCTPEDLAIENKMVFLKDDPDIFIHFKDLVHGYRYPDGPSIWGQMIGRGSYIMRRLVPMDNKTGKGKTGVSWTVGAQGVEIEYDPRLYTYRLIKAVTVIDAGKVINPKADEGVIMGGMSMGFGLATREEFLYDDKAKLQNTSLRTYKLMHFGEQPEYVVEFVETPQMDTPFGTRGIGEHGILGIPSAFANAISLATGEEFDILPISPELIWKIKTGGKHDTF